MSLPMEPFDETLLDDAEALARFDPVLRRLAESGARVRKEAAAAAEAGPSLAETPRPRAIVATGPDARLLRAVLEPWCPVPFVAWPGPNLPGWAGALDLVAVLAPGGADPGVSSSVVEAVRRGCGLLVAAPRHSIIAEHAASRATTLLPTQSDDGLAVAVVMLQALHHLGLGPEVTAESVAAALDGVALSCSPFQPLGANLGKDMAIALADALPLVWGGSVLAARAGRRVAEALRRTSGRAALAADAAHLLPVLTAASRRDLFADPFTTTSLDVYDEERPALVVLDDGTDDPAVREQRGHLLHVVEEHDLRAHRIEAREGPDVARYATLLATGTYAATYLAIGLGRPVTA
ncbi:MAG TPA: SIS domain-containing protein [Nocardioidaceae bacterium]|nr:SIS domain-containing protein [Nocardioidaceae bacterium]